MCMLIILTICSILGFANLFTKDPKWRVNTAVLGFSMLAWVLWFALLRRDNPIRHFVDAGAFAVLLIAGTYRVYHLRTKHGIQLPLEDGIMRLGFALWAVIKHPLMFVLTVIVATLLLLQMLTSFQLITAFSISWIWLAVALVPFLALAGIRIPNFIRAWKSWSKGACPLGYTAASTVAALEKSVAPVNEVVLPVVPQEPCEGQCADCVHSGSCPIANLKIVSKDGELTEMRV